MQRPTPPSLNDILITEELWQRPPREPNWKAESEALRSLTRQLVRDPDVMLQHLVDLAVELCKAGTAGVSLVEHHPGGEDVFRWVALSGTLGDQVGGCTPRNFSPCWVCLEQRIPVLFAYPERYFTYFQKANVPFVEGLVLPLMAEGEALGTIWIITHEEGRQFDPEDVRLMTGLADFTAAALLRNQQQTRELLVQNAQLTALEERYRVTLEAAELATWDWNSTTDRAFWNEQHYRLLGLAPRNEPETFERFVQFVHPEDRQRVRAAIERAIAQHTPYRATYRILRADNGELRWMTDAGQVIEEADGQGVRMSGVMYDSTDQHQAQDDLAESERNFRAIANIVPDLLWQSNPDGSTNWYSDRWLEYTGQTFEQAIGWGWIDAIHPDDWEESARRYREAVEQGVMLQQEYRIRRHDGAYRWFVVKASPLKDESGKVIKMYSAATDIHDRKQAEDALRESEDKYRALFMSMDEAYAVVEVLTDDNGEWNDFLFLEVNPVFVAQTGMEYPVGRRATELLGTPNPNWARVYGQVAETGEPIRFEEGEATLGRVFDLYVSRVGGEGSRRVAVLFTDITDRKRREANLTFLADLMNDFAPLVTAEEVMEMAGKRITEHLDLSRYMFVEIFPEAGTCTYLFPSHPPGQLEISGSFVLAEYHTEEEHRLLCAGHSMIVNDVRDGTRTPEQIAAFEVFDIGSIVNTPYLSNGRWVFDLGVARSKPSVWREDEIELLRELSARVWLRIERARAEASLRDSEAKYRTLFDSIDEGLAITEMIYDDQGEIVDIIFRQVNRAYERHGGVYNVVGRSIFDVIPGVEDYWLDLYKRVARTGESVREENYQQDVDRWFDVYFSRVDDNGRFVAIVFSDISDRKRRERQQEFLLNFSDYLRTLADEKAIEETGVRMLAEFLRLDRAYIFVLYPSEDRAVVRAEQRKENLASLLGEVRMSDFPETVRQIENQTLVINDIDSDARLSDLNRTSLDAVNLQAFVCASVRKGERNVIWSLAASTTVPRTWTKAEVELIETVAERMWAAVERARAEAALRESEEGRQIALEAAQMGTFVWFPQEDRSEPDARMLALFGLYEGDVLNLAEAIATMIHPDDRDLYAAAVTQSINPGGDGKLYAEIRVIHPDASLHWVAVTAQTVFEGQPPQPVRMYGIAADITARKQAEADHIRLIQEQVARHEAEQSSRMKDEFLSMVSHELQSPLVTILGWTRMLRANPPSPSELAKKLEIIERNATLQAKLIQDLLDISRITAGKLRLNCRPVNLETVLEDAIAPFQPAAIAKDIHLQCLVADKEMGRTPSAAANSDASPFQMVGDGDRLQQVFNNLLTNALKFTPAGGSVTVEVRGQVRGSKDENSSLDHETSPPSLAIDPSPPRSPSYAIISVTDTGMGISADFLPHVFDRFRQEEISGSAGGLGLGLAIARHIVASLKRSCNEGQLA